MTDNSSVPSRVVVGIDFSPSSYAAASWAANWVGPDSELVFVHALVIPEIGGFLADRFPLPQSLLRTARAGAESRLKDLRASFPDTRIRVEVREGRPADAVAETARDLGAELIVVGKHGENGHVREYTGRTADRLVRSSHVPVLLANPAPTPDPVRILVPLTYSSVVPFIVGWAARIARRFDAEVIALHVIGSAVLSHVLFMSSVPQGKSDLTQAEIDSVFSEETSEWKKKLVDAGVPAERVKSQVVFGEVSQEVLAAADMYGASMIVMGSHAGPVRRALLGSAASAVLRKAEIPVLVVVEPVPAITWPKTTNRETVNAGIT